MKFLYNNSFRQQFKTRITFQLDMEPKPVNMSSIANQQQGLQTWKIGQFKVCYVTVYVQLSSLCFEAFALSILCLKCSGVGCFF